MNERIQELIKQATHVEEPDGLFPREVFDKEKFAELIVRECAALIPAEQSHAPDGRPIAKIFEEHFGVKS